jgi:hypothetical protein
MSTNRCSRCRQPSGHAWVCRACSKLPEPKAFKFWCDTRPAPEPLAWIDLRRRFA